MFFRFVRGRFLVDHGGDAVIGWSANNGLSDWLIHLSNQLLVLHLLLSCLHHDSLLIRQVLHLSGMLHLLHMECVGW